MPVEDALQTLQSLRHPQQIVVTNQMSARLWPAVSDSPLDLNYNPSTMGGAVPLALGLALGQPARKVLAISGEGALLMSLGSLVTVVDSGVTNLTVIVLDNKMYEVTGGQRTAASANRVDFAGLARAAGFASVHHFQNDDAWRAGGAEAIAGSGPRFIWLEVQRSQPRPLPQPRPLREQLTRLQAAIT